MKKALSIFFLTILFTVGLSAETVQYKSMVSENIIISEQNINFTKEQQEKIKEIYEQYVSEVKKIENMEISQQAKEKAYKEVILKVRDKFSLFLTPEQLKALTEENV